MFRESLMRMFSSLYGRFTPLRDQSVYVMKDVLLWPFQQAKSNLLVQDKGGSSECWHPALFSVMCSETWALRGLGPICCVSSKQSAGRPISWVLRAEDAEREGGWRERPQDKSWSVLQRAWLCVLRGQLSWMLCLCWSGWLQADVANEGDGVLTRWRKISVFLRSDPSESAQRCCREREGRCVTVSLQLCPLPTHVHRPSICQCEHTNTASTNMTWPFTFPQPSVYTNTTISTAEKTVNWFIDKKQISLRDSILTLNESAYHSPNFISFGSSHVEN